MASVMTRDVTTITTTNISSMRNICLTAALRVIGTSIATGALWSTDISGTPVTTINYIGTGTAGSTNGAAGTGQVNTPVSIVTDSTYVYWSETITNKVRRALVSDQSINDFIGNGTSANVDGTGTAAQLAAPLALSIDTAGRRLFIGCGTSLRVANLDTGITTTVPCLLPGTIDAMTYDAVRNRIVFSVARQIWYVYALGGVCIAWSGDPGITVDTDGNGRASGFKDVAQMRTDGVNLYFGEANANTVRQVTLDGPYTATNVAGSGSGLSTDGNGVAAQFASVQGLALYPGATTMLVAVDQAYKKLRKIV